MRWFALGAVLMLAACGKPGPQSRDGSQPLPDSSGDGGSSDAGVAGADAGGADAGSSQDAGTSSTQGLCSKDHWCWEYPAVQGNGLKAVWGFSDSDVWGIGGNLFLHWDGSQWSATEINLPGYNSIDFTYEDIWGARPNDVWAVGWLRDHNGTQHGIVAHWDGTAWSASTAAAAPDVLGSIWGSGPSDVWAVGGAGNIVHWDGATWTSSPSGTNQVLNAIWGSSANDVWVAGDQGLVLHWDGSQWTAGAPLTAQHLFSLWGVAGASPEYWTASGTGELFHYAAGVWQSVPSPLSAPLWKLRGTSTTDIWGVGSAGLNAHWDGFVWTMGADAGLDLRSVWVSPSGKGWAGGAPGPMFTLEAGVWTPLSPVTPNLWGLWGFSDSDVWAVGEHGTALHFDGQQWSPVATGSGAYLKSVWGSSPSDVWAVGASAGVFDTGTALRWNGAAWSVANLPVLPALNAVSGRTASDIWAVGNGGTVAQFDSGSWSNQGNPLWPDLYGVWTRGSTDVFVVGDKGFLAHLASQQWVTTSMPSCRFWAVGGTSATDVWAVGNGALYACVAHWDGVSWSPDQFGAALVLQTVWTSFLGGDTVYNAVGTSMDLGSTLGVSALWGSGDGNLWATSSQGAILHLR